MHIDRRAVLIGSAAVAGGVVVGVVAERQGWWTPAIIGTPDADAAIARLSRRGEAAVVRAYDEALAGPALASAAVAERLRAFRGHHFDHLVALGGDESDVAEAPPPGRQDPDNPDGAPPVPALPESADALPGYFSAVEQQRATLLSTGVRISTDGELARLLGLIVASETAHDWGWRNG